MRSILTGFKLWISILLGSTFLACSQIPTTAKSLRGYALGTSYNIQYTAAIPEEQVQKGIDSLLDALNQSLSTYIPQSDISKINRGDSTLVVDRHFKAVFTKATEVWQATGGYFDPTVGALVNAYGFGPGKPLKSLGQKQIDSLLFLTGWDKVQILPSGRVKKKYADIYIDFNALAKGYVVDVIGDYLSDLGNSDYMVEIGGEVVARGYSPKSKGPWKIAIDDPRQGEQRSFLKIIQLKDRALASSGNYRKYRTDPQTGERYVHSVNPKSGTARRTRVLSTSVLAPDCMTADAWATALMVMPPERGKQLIESFPDLAALWVIAQKDQFELTSSARWKE